MNVLLLSVSGGPSSSRQPLAHFITTNDINTGHGFFMYRKCMYCQTVFGTKPCTEAMHEETSHGICTIFAAFYLTMELEDLA